MKARLFRAARRDGHARCDQIGRARLQQRDQLVVVDGHQLELDRQLPRAARVFPVQEFREGPNHLELIATPLSLVDEIVEGVLRGQDPQKPAFEDLVERRRVAIRNPVGEGRIRDHGQGIGARRRAVIARARQAARVPVASAENARDQAQRQKPPQPRPARPSAARIARPALSRRVVEHDRQIALPRAARGRAVSRRDS